MKWCLDLGLVSRRHKPVEADGSILAKIGQLLHELLVDGVGSVRLERGLILRIVRPLLGEEKAERTMNLTRKP